MVTVLVNFSAFLPYSLLVIDYETILLNYNLKINLNNIVPLRLVKIEINGLKINGSTCFKSIIGFCEIKSLYPMGE